MVNIGDKVVITKMSSEVLEEPRVATVKDVGGTWFEIDELILGEDVVMKDSSVDDWYKADEDSDDEYKIMPNYVELASGGMTFSEFAGEDITEESLNFRPYDDKVNHPSHYNKYSREVIESIKGLCTPEEFRGYLKGNIIKYSARYSDKDGVQDIDKLAKYTQFLKEFELEQAELSEEE